MTTSSAITSNIDLNFERSHKLMPLRLTQSGIASQSAPGESGHATSIDRRGISVGTRRPQITWGPKRTAMPRTGALP